MAQALVHKQFNSPIGLYSDNNIKETLNRELKTLSNGTVGIDFSNDPAAHGISKAANLANSAVLKMLEEEEEQRRQGVNTGYRTVAWPPPNETHLGAAANAPEITAQSLYLPQPQYQQQQQNQQQHQGYPSAQDQPLSPAPAYTPQSPAAAPQYHQQQQQYQPQQYQQQASVNSGRGGYGQQQPTMSAVSQPQQQQQQQPVTYRQPTPLGMVTLRQSTPISQKPNPVYQAQPPVSSFKGGANMRGDMKWPPEDYKQQAALENEARLRLAAGPACRPRRVNKDYGSFFARHALNTTYPGYRIPPGTQHYPNEDMM